MNARHRCLVTRREFNAAQIHIVGRIRIDFFYPFPVLYPRNVIWWFIVAVAGRVVPIGGGMLPVVAAACSQWCCQVRKTGDEVNAPVHNTQSIMGVWSSIVRAGVLVWGSSSIPGC
ncbi:hypothetical protein Pmani_039568 [Petrolisthes manimaculis]|uniref:Uncharacterized protein n=1 Tax=Petrolisthes manimaculis TaxID=1843537 RepID=A0AAE1TJ63_9EUCA|nr:hypothetical protein Pmani_039568 [Petrolisthes manimaculis]